MTTLRRRLRAMIPPAALRVLIVARGWWSWIRVQAPIVRILGREFRRSRTLVEIDVTWACNLRCFNCNRSCEQAPTGERVTVEQVIRFVNDSIARGLTWKRVRVLGGEPTLHPELLEILEVLRDWRRRHAPDTRIELVTNGHGSRVREVLTTIPGDIFVENTAKEGREQPFFAFNVAPVDLPLYRNADYRSGCGVTTNCGIGLTPRGWYPCAVAGGIDRIFEFGLGRDGVPETEDDMLAELETFCRVCGLFDRRVLPPVLEPVSSPTWSAAYGRYLARRNGGAFGLDLGPTGARPT
jgi:hypothetical protein